MTARLLKDPSTVNSRVFVGHLQTDELSRHELEDHFSKYGNVVGSLLNRGFGFVQFEEEQSAQKAIQNEHGAMFKGRRIDVRPAKKDGGFVGNSSGGGAGGGGAFGGNQSVGTGKVGLNTFGGPSNDPFNNTNDSFNNTNQNFTGNNQSFNNMNRNSHNDQFTEDEPITDGNDQFDHSNANRSGGGNGIEPFTSPNRSGNNQFGPGSNPNRNPSNQGGNASSGEGSGGGNGNNIGTSAGGNGPPGNRGSGDVGSGSGGRRRGTRGGKNRNKNRDNRDSNNFRDRSPVRRVDDKMIWDLNKTGGMTPGNIGPSSMGSNAIGSGSMNQSGIGPGPVGRSNFNRDSFNDGNRFSDFKTSGMRDMNMSFSGPGNSGDYPPSTPEKNDCEIIVVNKSLTEYAETIEMRLKKIGLTVDLLFPNEDVLLSRVLGNIASRGCLYAVVVTPVNKEHHSLTLNILHGLPQEHRNMPVENAINLIARNFANYKSGGRSVPLNTPLASERHPDAIQVLLNMLADNHQLTVLQYDRVLKYLEVKREEQVQQELGDVKDLPPTSLTVNDPKQAELQSRILNILNSNKNTSSASAPSPVPAPISTSAPPSVRVPSTNWGAAASTTAASVSSTATTTATSGVSPSPLLNDPTVQKALDSLLQGNLLKSIGGDQQTTTSSTPLFAAFPNIGRF